MPRSLKPPRGIFTGTRFLFDRDLSPNTKETLLQLMALTWGNEFHFTPPLTYPLLEDLTGKDARTLRGHLLALKNFHTALRSQYAGDGRFIFFLAPWLFQDDVPIVETEDEGSLAALLDADNLSAGESLPDAVKEEEVNLDFKQEIDINLLLLPDHSDHSDHSDQPDQPDQPDLADFLDQSAKPAAKMPLEPRKPAKKPNEPPAAKTSSGNPPAGKPKKPPKRKKRTELLSLDPEVQVRLVKAGVFPVLLGEVARRAKACSYSSADLLALLAWCQAEQPENAAKLFMGRLRSEARAPARPEPESTCPRCGKAGEHAPGCPHRYLMD